MPIVRTEEESNLQRERVRDEIQAIRDELDEYYRGMKALQASEPDQIFLKLAAWSARVSEIRVTLVRSQTRSKQALRTQEVDPFLEEIDRQFKFFSRYQSVREMDFKIVGKL